MRGISRMMLLWIGLFAMASTTGSSDWTYTAGVVGAIAVLPLLAMTASKPGRHHRYDVRRTPIAVRWSRDRHR